MSAHRLTATAANIAWWSANVPTALAFRAALHRPRAVQTAILRRYVERNAQTAFGRSHRLDRIHSPRDFADRVPIATYDELAPHIDRIAAGETNVLTREPVIRFATSSGSTRARKLIPYTRTLQREFNRAVGPWIVDLYARFPQLVGGCAYWSITPLAQNDSIEPASGDAPPIGFEEDSGYLGGWAARLVDAVMAVPGSIRHIRDIDVSRYVTLRLLLARADLRLISVWHPSFLELLLDSAATHWQALVSDIERGTCSVPLSDSERALSEVDRHYVAAPERATYLRGCRPDDVAMIWPRLRLVSCWADAHAKPAADQLSKRVAPISLQPKGLLATEAVVTIPFAGSWPLAVRSHFFEFVDDHGRVRLCDELKVGGEYGLLVTTGGGLWRYRIGDRVRVDGRLGATPSLRFIGREDRVVDRFGEKLNEGFVGSVIRALLAAANIAAGFSMLAPELDSGAARYVLFIDAPKLISLSVLARQLDDQLSHNPHYAYCRALKQLGPAEVVSVGTNATAIYLHTLVKAGQRLGDIKPSALSDRTDWRAIFSSTDALQVSTST